MANYLLNVRETWRADNEEEANGIIEEAKSSRDYDLTKFDCTYKQQKSKGEVIDDWYRVTLTKEFTSEKEPDRSVIPSYGGDL